MNSLCRSFLIIFLDGKEQTSNPGRVKTATNFTVICFDSDFSVTRTGVLFEYKIGNVCNPFVKKESGVCTLAKKC